ncbi:hypothetical protein C0585_01785 [Candidatus Woesearchaeota archaeon]|nr:MAG: hypothetical protein C0585_01785 [Candidatus Woesearchaeota archaeon]
MKKLLIKWAEKTIKRHKERLWYRKRKAEEKFGPYVSINTDDTFLVKIARFILKKTDDSEQ